MTSAAAAPGQETPKGHPPALYILFFAELWERFSFYGMRALLVLYMTNAFLGYDEEHAYGVYAAYSTLVYASPIIGGWLADKVMGYRRSVMWGAILMAIGHFAMAFENSQVFYLALGLIAIGNGFFKPNISSMVGQLYKEGDPRRDGGFTIFYMGINIGAMIAPLACGYLGEKVGWHYGFSLAGVGMLVGLVVFQRGQKKLGEIGLPPRDGAMGERYGPLSKGNLIYLGTALAIPVFALLLNQYGVSKVVLGVALLAVILPMVKMAFAEEVVQRQRIFVYFILFAFHTAFWAFFEQAGSSLTTFADKNVQRQITESWLVPTSWFQSVNPLFIVMLGPLFSNLWISLDRKGFQPSIPMKFALGLFQLGLGFAVLVWGAGQFATNGLTPATVLILMYLLHTMGELCLSPVGLSAVTKLAPPKAVGYFMGSWFLSIALGHTIAGMIAGETASDEMLPEESLEVFSGVYWQGALILMGLGVFLALSSKLINKMTHGVK